MAHVMAAASVCAKNMENRLLSAKTGSRSGVSYSQCPVPVHLTEKEPEKNKPQKDIFKGRPRHPSRACPTNGSDRGSLRSHDLTLFVMPLTSLAILIIRPIISPVL